MKNTRSQYDLPTSEHARSGGIDPHAAPSDPLGSFGSDADGSVSDSARPPTAAPGSGRAYSDGFNGAGFSGRFPGARRARRNREQVAATSEAGGDFAQDLCKQHKPWVNPAPAVPESELPGYIRACAHNPDPKKRMYWVYTWPRDQRFPHYVTRRPYTCNSWRCPYGVCAQHEAHVMFARMSEAFAPYPPEHLVFMVLTLSSDQQKRRHYDLKSLYRELRRRVEMFVKRLRRFLEREGVEPFGSEWVSTVEQHRSGVPHVNMLIGCEAFAKWVKIRTDGNRLLGLDDRESTLLGRLDGELAEHLEACGLGWRCTAEIAQSRDKVIGYLGKIARWADQTHAEIAKVSQLPVKAPKGFRRLRSGRNFLPKRHKGDKTGTIVRRVVTREGDEEVRPLVRSQNEQYNLVVDAVCKLEQQLAWSEEDEKRELARKRRLGIPTVKNRDEQTTVHRMGRDASFCETSGPGIASTREGVAMEADTG